MSGRLSRRSFFGLAAAGAAAAGCGKQPPTAAPETANTPAVPAFELDELSIAQLRERMASGQYTAVRLTELYLERIGRVDRDGPRLNSVIELNPEAPALAAELDRERQAGRVRGPLHGIPVLVKDNIGTADRMTTTAGSLALEGSICPEDSGVARRLREAGAVLLGKTNLSEWANYRSSDSTSSWSGRGGLTRSPYALDRNPSGSSSGSGAAAAASLCAGAVGTETDGSIIGPACCCGIVGLKPTVGLVSRAWVIPISHTQDSPGPMTRTVEDTALLLGAMAGPDPRDPATLAAQGKYHADYTRFLDPGALKGKRLGVARRYTGYMATVDKLFEQALEALKAQGAELIDPVTVPNTDYRESVVLLHEFKADLNSYLAGLGPNAPVHSLAEVIAFNEAHADRELPYFGQDIFLSAQEQGPLTSREYLEALEQNYRMSRAEGIDQLMDEQRLDAIIAPSGGPAFMTDLVCGNHDQGGCTGPAAVAGYPILNVPCGEIFGMPVGLSLFGRAWSEPVLLAIAYAYEQATRLRKPPRFLTTAELAVGGRGRV